MDNRVTIVPGGCRCPHCGVVKEAEYKAQDPAPCGCAWVWDESTGLLIATPSRERGKKPR